MSAPRSEREARLVQREASPCCLHEIFGVEADVSAYAHNLLQLGAHRRLIEVGRQAMRVVLDQLAQPDWNRRSLLSDLIANVGEKEVLRRVREAVEGSVAVLEGAIVWQAKDVRGEQRRKLSRRATVLGPVRARRQLVSQKG